MIETINPIQNQRFEYEEKRQQVNELEMMIADFRRLANDLDQQIKIEQQASGISDVNHFAYPTFARAAINRRDNLRASVSELEKRLERARQEALDAFEQLKLSEFGGRLGSSPASEARLSAGSRKASRVWLASGKQAHAEKPCAAQLPTRQPQFCHEHPQWH